MRKKFDKEYSTQFKDEVKFLSSVGISYVFVKNICNISTYKYVKNKELFVALSDFYK